MGVRTDTRERMVTSAALLLRQHGVAGTSVARVLNHSGGPRGSVGHHFPGGRTQILTEALHHAGQQVSGALRQAHAHGASGAEVFAAVCGHYAEQLATTDFSAGCPVGAAAQEAYRDHDLGPVVTQILTDWIGGLGELLVEDGHTTATARDLATLAVSTLEGAIMVARVQRSTAPIDTVLAQIGPLLKAPDEH